MDKIKEVFLKDEENGVDEEKLFIKDPEVYTNFKVVAFLILYGTIITFFWMESLVFYFWFDCFFILEMDDKPKSEECNKSKSSWWNELWQSFTGMVKNRECDGWELTSV